MKQSTQKDISPQVPFPHMKQRSAGKILSDKMNETVVVQVEKVKQHPKYKKTYRVSLRYKAHNAGNRYKEGDYVVLEATRPLSKEKRWRIVEKAISNKQ